MALCDYFKLVTTVIVTAVWAMYFLEAMVGSPGLLDIHWLAKALHRAKNEQHSTNVSSQATEIYWQ